MRDRLIWLIRNAKAAYGSMNDAVMSEEEFIADFILADGVIVPPVKVGQTVYAALRECGEHGEDVVEKWEVEGVSLFDGQWYAIDSDANEYEIGGEYCLFTREEAEQALKGGEG